MLSLSIAPYFARFPTGWKWLLAYFLWTPVYALTLRRLSAEPTSDVRGFYLGMTVPLWITVQGSAAVGAAFSARVPTGPELEFVVPLAFVALLVNFLTDRATEDAALVGGVLAVLAGGVPLGLGVVVATIGGTVAGVLVAAREVEA